MTSFCKCSYLRSLQGIANFLWAFLHNTAFLAGFILLSIFSAFLPLIILWAVYSVFAHISSWLFAAGVRPAWPEIDWVPLSQNTLIHLALVIAWGLLCLLVWNGAKQAMRHRKRQLQRLAKGRLVKVSADHPIALYTQRLCKQHRIRCPHLWAAENAYVVAFVVAPPIRKSHLVLSAGVLQLPSDILRWVIAHEVGHLVHGDARHVFAWQRFLDSVLAWQRLRLKVVKWLVRLCYWIPLVGHPLCRLLVGFERLFQNLDKAGRQLGGAAYEALTLWASRRSEFRADAFAASQEGAEPGIALFRSLAAASTFEPLQRPICLRTHPTHHERVKALKRFNLKPHNLN